MRAESSRARSSARATSADRGRTTPGVGRRPGSSGCRRPANRSRRGSCSSPTRPAREAERAGGVDVRARVRARSAGRRAPCRSRSPRAPSRCRPRRCPTSTPRSPPRTRRSSSRAGIPIPRALHVRRDRRPRRRRHDRVQVDDAHAAGEIVALAAALEVDPAVRRRPCHRPTAAGRSLSAKVRSAALAGVMGPVADCRASPRAGASSPSSRERERMRHARSTLNALAPANRSPALPAETRHAAAIAVLDVAGDRERRRRRAVERQRSRRACRRSIEGRRARRG